MRKRRVKVLILILLSPVLLVLLVGAFLVFERVRGAISLNRYKREMIAKGEKLSARDLRRQPAAGENGAPEILAAIKQLKDGVVLPNNYPPRMRLTPSGRAIVGFREEEWLESRTTNHWEQLAADLGTNAAALHQIRLALEKPVLDNQLDLSLGPKMSFSHLPHPKQLTHWFGASSQLALHEARNHDALKDLLAEGRLGRMLAEDRIVISELVRDAIEAVARTGVWEALQSDDWTDEELRELQGAWESQSFATNMAWSLEGELVFGLSGWDQMRKSNEETIANLYGWAKFLDPEDSERPWWERTLRDFPGGQEVVRVLKEQVYCRIWRFAWLDQSELSSLKAVRELLGLARTAATQKSFEAVRPGLEALLEKSLNKNIYDELRNPGPNSFAALLPALKRAVHAETERSVVICAISLKRYFLKHGQLPDSLGRFVPEFLSAVPIDYMDGKPIRYRLNGDGSFLLYSVGEDGKDDGGDSNPMPEKTGRQNLWDRKDFVWPSPATSEELETYRREAARE